MEQAEKAAKSAWYRGMPIQCVEDYVDIFEEEDDLNPREYIYFMQRGGIGPIKIGLTINPDKRRSDIAVHSAEPVRLVGLFDHGSSDREAETHGLFKDESLSGEWFQSSRFLVNFIKNAMRGNGGAYGHLAYLCEQPNSHEDVFGATAWSSFSDNPLAEEVTNAERCNDLVRLCLDSGQG